jgi:hypothetical protein
MLALVLMDHALIARAQGAEVQHAWPPVGGAAQV